MTFGDVLDQVARASGDDSVEYRADLTRWLNLARQYIADSGPFKGVTRVNQSLVTSDSNTTGVYSLTGFEGVVGPYIWNQDDGSTIRYEADLALASVDPQRETVSTPQFWSDAGRDASGNRQIRLWPIPDAQYQLRFTGVALLSDITAENLTEDPYFGPLTVWGATLVEGVRFYQRQDDNESAEAINLQLQAFDRLIRLRRRSDALGKSVSSELRNVRFRDSGILRPRLDPAHYDNG